MLLEGLHIPVTTPFFPDGRLHPAKLAANVIRYSKTPAAGLILLAPHAGEPTLLTDPETIEALSTAAQAAAPEKVLLAAIARDSSRAALTLIREIAGLGYDAVLLAAPTVAVGNPELLAWFRTVADSSALPVVLYSPAQPLDLALIADLAHHPNIIGLVDASPAGATETLLKQPASVRRDVTVTSVFCAVTARMQQAAATSDFAPQTTLVSAMALARNPAAAATAVAAPPAPVFRTRTKSVGFQILAAHPAALLASLRAGATGIAPAFSACAPQACYEVFAAWKDEDQPLADEKLQRLQPAAELALEAGPGALKSGCDLNGYYGGPPRMPYLPVGASERSALQTLMSSMRS